MAATATEVAAFRRELISKMKGIHEMNFRRFLIRFDYLCSFVNAFSAAHCCSHENGVRASKTVVISFILFLPKEISTVVINLSMHIHQRMQCPISGE